MPDDPSPTQEGQRRWPHTQGYHPDVSATDTQPDPDLPCTCSSTCAQRCAGECGCKACAFAFVEFCDVAGLIGPGGPTVDDDEALARWAERRNDVSHAAFAVELDAAGMASDGFHPGEPVYRVCGEALALHVARIVGQGAR